MSQPRADHPHTDPGDGRIECDTCGKWVHLVIHSCKRVPVTVAAVLRWEERRGQAWPLRPLNGDDR